jgi:1,4-alpha-glucan branching enzyme
VQTIAEESTSWPMVSRPVAAGGLGFGFKWDMGWMHDALRYFRRDPIHRRHHHAELTFRSLYAFAENFVLSLSHDEVVHGKGALLAKMPGDDWQKLANLRLLYAWMFAQPGKKLLFMGGEIAQPWEWSHEGSIAWHLEDQPAHRGVEQLIADLNALYRGVAALHQLDGDAVGFEWIDADDAERSCYALLRKDQSGGMVAVVLNCTPAPRHNYRIGVPAMGFWREVLNTDSTIYGGSGQGNHGQVEASPVPSHGREFSLNLVLPPLGAVFLERVP